MASEKEQEQAAPKLGICLAGVCLSYFRIKKIVMLLFTVWCSDDQGKQDKIGRTCDMNG